MNSVGIKNKLLKFVSSWYFPLIFFSLAMVVLHIYITPGKYDDEWFRDILATDCSFKVWLNYLVERYHTWTSRMPIEALLIVMVQVPILWRALNAVMMVWIAVAMSLFFNRNQKASVNWFIVIALLSLPLTLLDSAGWIATTLNYTWTSAAGLFAMLPIRNAVIGKKTHLLIYIFSVPCLIFAVGHEQMCAVMLAVSGLFTIYLFVRDKKIPWFIALEAVICVLALVFIMTCPGNAARTARETEYWFPLFSQLSFLKKLELGYSRAMFGFSMSANLVYTLFCGTLFAAVYLNSSKAVLRWVSAIPFIFSLTMGLFGGTFDSIIPTLNGIRHSMTETGTGIILTSPRSWIPILFVTGIGICIIISLWTAFKNKQKSMLSIFIILLGTATVAVMGFSPTIWASYTRPFTFMYFAFIAVSVILAENITNSGKCRKLGAFYNVFGGAYIMFVIDQWLSQQRF